MPLFLPLNLKPKCQQCSSTKRTRLCAACGEISYCSRECQKLDWNRHKPECGNTDKIELSTFYPFLAILVDFGHQSASLKYPALTHRIVNDARQTTSSGGWDAVLLELGYRSARAPEGPVLRTKDWWPKANDLRELNNLRARIRREGSVLPILFALCLSLVDVLYTTTYNRGRDETRFRLHYDKLPIVDFGIYNGSIEVDARDKLAYKTPDGTYRRGQDPADHYWLYFTNSRGEEFTLDCATFTFGFDEEVNNRPYIPEHELLALFPTSPAWTNTLALDPPTTQHRPRTVTIRRRISVLRHPAVQRAFRRSESFGGQQQPLYLLGFFPSWTRSRGRNAA